MSWHCSQALAAAFSGASSSGGNACAPSNTNPQQDGCSPQGKTMDASNPSQSGTTLEPSMESHGVAWWMSSLAASRAKTSQPLEKEPDSTASEAASGLKCLGSLARFDLDSRSWKTHQFSLLGGLESFSETWPRWGMMRGGECWELSTPELRTKENESGLWVTPCATDSKPITGGNLYQTRTGTVRHMRPDGKSSNRGLEAQVIWPTITVCGNYNRKGASKHSGDGLATAVKQWPTPTVQDAKNNGAPAQMERNTKPLNAEVGGALNPTWVEWLMGWPLGWTDSAHWGTDKFRQWCASHGIF
jgi:hypothetical protein